MKVCQFVVPGEPVAKGRPRFARQGQYVRTYTPKKTEDYEKFVQLCWRRQSGVVFPERTALAVKIRAYFKIPKSISNRKRAEMIGKPHIKKADGDNIAKSIMALLTFGGLFLVAVTVLSILLGVPMWCISAAVVLAAVVWEIAERMLKR